MSGNMAPRNQLFPNSHDPYYSRKSLLIVQRWERGGGREGGGKKKNLEEIEYLEDIRPFLDSNPQKYILILINLNFLLNIGGGIRRQAQNQG